MPKIRITETDKTGRVQGGAISNVVYLPIRFNKAEGGFQVTNKTAGVGDFASLALFRSTKDFEDAAKKTVTVTNSGEGTGASTMTEIAIIDPTSLGYRLCVHLLNLGYQVLVEALADTETADSVKYTPSWDLLRDKSLYDVRFLTLGAMVEGTDGDKFDLSGEVSDMLSCAADRGDCVGLVNVDESGEDFDYEVTAVREAFADLSDGEYGAAFTPWFYSSNSDLANADGSAAKIPAAFGYLFAYANATKNSPEWYAIAGFERGIIPELSNVCHSYTTAEVEVLQARSAAEEVDLDEDGDNVGYAINPICYVRPAGYIIYGNRTLRVNDAGKKLIASSFLNIRNGLSAIKKVMYEASRKYTFEQNTETLWINFQSYITPLLDKMQAGNGILGYTFIKQKTNAKARLKAKLNLIPVEAVEDFDLEVVLADDLTVSE